MLSKVEKLLNLPATTVRKSNRSFPEPKIQDPDNVTMEPDFNVTPNFQALDDVTMEPVSNPAPNLAQDSTRVQPPSGKPGTRPQQGPTLADIVSGAEPIVRGMSAAEHQQQRVQLPRPRAADIAAILQLYESTTPATFVSR